MHGSKLNQEATNTYSHSFSTKIVEEFFSQNQTISGQQIISVTSIKQVNFFILKALFDEWQGEIKKFKSPYFDYKNEDVNQALKALVNTLSKHIEIQKDDFQPLLEKAVSSTIELLYDPAQFYLRELGRSKTSDKSRELKGGGKYIKLYKSLFDQILTSLDQDRDHNKAVQEVVSAYPEPSDEKEQIIDLFNQTLTLNVIEEHALQEVSMPSPLDTLDQDMTSSHEPPLADEINDEFEPLKDEEKEISSDNINQQYSEDIKTLNQKYEEKEKARTIAAVHETQSLSNLKSNININQRYMFVNDLFEGNDQDYEVAMDEVENCKSFDSSVELLVQNYAKKYAWDMNTDEVKELLKVIFKRFR